MDGGGSLGSSPFHPGEQAAQERLGLRDKMAGVGRRIIRDHLPDQHREFYGLLPFLLVGSVDDAGRPWASLLAGPPGFLSTPDARNLDVAALPLPGDPLTDHLREGAELGVLGIQPATRRRNRLSGTLQSVRDDGFRIAVAQSFGNCPQYIQAREVDWQAAEPAAARVERRSRFSADDRRLIARADTLFIATASGAVEGAARGADVSHRGGKPGFVRIEGDDSFVLPDYSGNYHFNTVGNILVNPKAGFLFLDFERGRLLYLTGAAEIVWEGEAVEAFAGAERLIRFRLEQAVAVRGSLPLSFRFQGFSPKLAQTGDWDTADQIMAAERERDTYLDYEVVDLVPESGTIRSLVLRRADCKAPASYRPGQFLPIRLEIPGQEGPVTRTYTLSGAPDGEYYRLSIKRDGLVSRYLHDHAGVGFRLQAMAPRGRFVLDEESERPVVLLSAGVGITPMMAMAGHLLKEGERTRHFRRTTFIHSARNGEEQAFTGTLRDWARRYDSLTVHVRYSQPGPADRLGETHDSEGRIDIALLKKLLPLDDYDFYLCGPAGFMQGLYDGLMGIGVQAERIHYEAFRPATVIKSVQASSARPAGAESTAEPVTVRFDASDREAVWTPEQGTLLDLAEAAGLSPAHACRSGICGSCATKMKSGSVGYTEEPVGPHEPGEVLICSATPRAPDAAADGDGKAGIVLDL
ncbi:pyridoxamine 5'-phosphate oxidase family protein [Pelagibius sp.]|uniref:pyridoxamine 5'-phosphate oxidase family protein n=1 Tax=Pelagibius sp. TaxID=1931238 RepID=UPI003BB138F6